MATHTLPNYPVSLCQQLWQLQKNGELCDTMLVGRDGFIQVHQVVLAAFSPRILAQYLQGKCINLPSYSVACLEAFASMAYKGEMLAESSIAPNLHALLVDLQLTQIAEVYAKKISKEGGSLVLALGEENEKKRESAVSIIENGHRIPSPTNLPCKEIDGEGQLCVEDRPSSPVSKPADSSPPKGSDTSPTPESEQSGIRSQHGRKQDPASITQNQHDQVDDDAIASSPNRKSSCKTLQKKNHNLNRTKSITLKKLPKTCKNGDKKGGAGSKTDKQNNIRRKKRLVNQVSSKKEMQSNTVRVTRSRKLSGDKQKVCKVGRRTSQLELHEDEVLKVARTVEVRPEVESNPGGNQVLKSSDNFEAENGDLIRPVSQLVKDRTGNEEEQEDIDDDTSNIIHNHKNWQDDSNDSCHSVIEKLVKERKLALVKSRRRQRSSSGSKKINENGERVRRKAPPLLDHLSQKQISEMNFEALPDESERDASNADGVSLAGTVTDIYGRLIHGNTPEGNETVENQLAAKTLTTPVHCLCGRPFIRMPNLARHRATCFEKVYQCENCTEMFNSESERDVHSTTCQHILKTGRFKCMLCGRVLGHAHLIQLHHRAHTDPPKQLSGVKEHHTRWPCELCPKQFRSVRERATHMYGRHKVPYDENQFTVYRCETDGCKHQTIQLRMARIHADKHGDATPFSCKFCDKQFKLKESRDCHQRSTHAALTYVCNDCGKSYKGKKGLTDHIRRYHRKERNYLCSECPYQAFALNELESHQYMKHGIPFEEDRPHYPCQFCSYIAHTPSTLSIHLRRHTGEKPFQCETCGKRYGSKGQLAGHLKFHKEERNYRCPHEDCSYSSKTSQGVKYHIQSMHTPANYKPYICGILSCGYSTKLRGNLALHLRNKHKLHVQSNHRVKRVASSEEITKTMGQITQVAIIDGHIGRLKTPEDDGLENGSLEHISPYVESNTDSAMVKYVVEEPQQTLKQHLTAGSIGVTDDRLVGHKSDMCGNTVLSSTAHTTVPSLYPLHLRTDVNQIDTGAGILPNLTSVSQLPSSSEQTINSNTTLVQSQGQSQGQVPLSDVPSVQHGVTSHGVQIQSSQCPAVQIPANMAPAGHAQVQGLNLSQTHPPDGHYAQLTASNLAIIQHGQNDLLGLMRNIRESFQGNFTGQL